jgi:hypothetical protein
MVSQATFSLSRCERSGLQCEGMSLSGQPWMALCKWQPGPFSHSSQLLQPLTSQRQEQLAQPVPEEKSIQSLQPDPSSQTVSGQRDRSIGPGFFGTTSSGCAHRNVYDLFNDYDQNSERNGRKDYVDDANRCK